MSNRRVLSGKGGTYVITRRFLPDGNRNAMRVRVTAYEGYSVYEPRKLWTDFRDFDDMHEGDMAYAKQISKIRDHCQAEQDSPPEGTVNSTHTTAPLGTPCGWTHGSGPCQSGQLAVHVLTDTLPVAPAGTALCGLHSPYDVTPEERALSTIG